MLIILLSGGIDEEEPNIQQAALGTAAAGTLDTVEEPLGAADDTALQHIVVAGLVLEVQEEME